MPNDAICAKNKKMMMKKKKERNMQLHFALWFRSSLFMAAHFLSFFSYLFLYSGRCIWQ